MRGYNRGEVFFFYAQIAKWLKEKHGLAFFQYVDYYRGRALHWLHAACTAVTPAACLHPPPPQLPQPREGWDPRCVWRQVLYESREWTAKSVYESGLGDNPGAVYFSLREQNPTVTWRLGALLKCCAVGMEGSWMHFFKAFAGGSLVNTYSHNAASFWQPW